MLHAGGVAKETSGIMRKSYEGLVVVVFLYMYILKGDTALEDLMRYHVDMV